MIYILPKDFEYKGGNTLTYTTLKVIFLTSSLAYVSAAATNHFFGQFTYSNDDRVCYCCPNF